ncbi:MAG: cupin domain-containing protein [Gemmataceae bacterium]
MQTQFFPSQEGEFRRILFPGVEARVDAGEHLTLSRVFMVPFSVVESHSHPQEQVGIVVEGAARFDVGGESKVLGPGDVYRIPGGVTHSVHALEKGLTAFDVFFPKRLEYHGQVGA